MLYTVLITKKARKFLADLKNESLYLRLREAINSLAENAAPPGSKNLTNRPGYRLRVGDYRIIYTVDGGELIITVIEIGHRKDIYR
jgi:mRNA interferase RelE/StbE